MLNAINRCTQQSEFETIMAFLGASQAFFECQHLRVTELYVRQLSEKRDASCLRRTLEKFYTSWKLEWMAVGYGCIWVYNKVNKKPSEMVDCIQLDPTTELEISEITSQSVTIILETGSKKITFKVKDTSNGLIFCHHLLKAISLSVSTKPHDHQSFSPVRSSTRTRADFLLRGERYFRQVYESIRNAKFEIMICDWMLSPEFPLIRPMGLTEDLDNSQSSIMHLLRAAAERGVPHELRRRAEPSRRRPGRDRRVRRWPWSVSWCDPAGTP